MIEGYIALYLSSISFIQKSYKKIRFSVLQETFNTITKKNHCHIIFIQET